MIEVQHNEADSNLLAYFPQNVKQRHGIGAAGNTHPDTSAGVQHLMALDRIENRSV
jgi:hypothetical protein